MLKRHCGCCLVLVSTLLFHGCGEGEERYPLRFQSGDPESDLAPRFFPKGGKIELAPITLEGREGHDHLRGVLHVGPEAPAETDRTVVLGRSAEGGPYDRLWVDRDGDGDPETVPVLEAEVRELRGKTWSSFGEATLSVRHPEDGADDVQEYGVKFWLAVEDPAAPPEALRCGRTGFKTASLEIDGRRLLVFLADGGNDGNFGRGDWWTVAEGDRLARPFNHRTSRDVGDFAWALGRAWMLELEGTAGLRGALVSHDPGITLEEDEMRRDTYRDDRLAPRAEEPVVFRTDANEAIARARREGKPYFVKFEAEWCGPCKQMDKLVYTAESVAKAAEGVVSIKVDGDERKDLCEQLGVEGFPAGVLFDGSGEEVARFSGYRSVAQMTAFFGKAPE
jgi:thiol-disulfide isomerase/thioredoxin